MFTKRSACAPSSRAEERGGAGGAQRKARNYLERLSGIRIGDRSSCFDALVIDAHFSSSPREARYHRGWISGSKARSAPFNLRPSPRSLVNDNVHNSGAPENFTISWSTRMRPTGGRGRQSRPEKCRKGRRRHKELFIKPSSRRISDRAGYLSRRDTRCKYKVIPAALPRLPVCSRARISYARARKYSRRLSSLPPSPSSSAGQKYADLGGAVQNVGRKNESKYGSARSDGADTFATTSR